MSHRIIKTYKDALTVAKTRCIRKLESAEGIQVNDESFINDGSLWLIKDITGSCRCGETPAVEVSLFCSKISDDLLGGQDMSIDGSEEIYSDYVNICVYCGDED